MPILLAFPKLTSNNDGRPGMDIYQGPKELIAAVQNLVYQRRRHVFVKHVNLR
jgi:hypothetical protein